MRPVADLRATLATLDEELSGRDRFSSDLIELQAMRVAVHDELVEAARYEGERSIQSKRLRDALRGQA